MKGCISVINSGSSSIKFSLFSCDEKKTLKLLYDGQIERIGTSPRFSVKDNLGQTVDSFSWETSPAQETLLSHIISWLRNTRLRLDLQLLGVGHRIAHGGNLYKKPVVVNEEVLTKLDTLSPLAPLHQPYNLGCIRSLLELGLDVPQIACFDTCFHQTNAPHVLQYGLPKELTQKGIHRFGFHGLSYEYIATRFREIAPDHARGKVIVAHLGSGASMCGMSGCKSIASSMGFSALDGLVMSTRPGNLDPGILLYLLDEEGMDTETITRLLYNESGLFGISGISKDMRVLLKSDEPGAKEAIDIFVYRIQREIGSLVAALGGLDSLIFTAGIGENSAEIRSRICAASSWLGIAIDDAANNSNSVKISSSESGVAVWTIPTDEERMIATHTRDLLFGERS